MINSLRAALFLMMFLSETSAFSFPMFLDAFRADSYRRATVDGCATCHVNPEGGGARNPFGQAFETGGETITPLLRANWPDRFSYPTSTSGTLTVHFSDPANRQAVIETAGTKTLIDLAARTAGNQPAAQPASAQSEAPAAAPPQTDTGNVDPYAREGVLFGMQVVNLPTGKPMRKGGVDFMIGHRFFQPVYNYRSDPANPTQTKRFWNSMLGFDGPAQVAYGFRVGVTDHVQVGFLRSNLDRTMEFNSMANITRQSDDFPITLALRGGIEFRNNFKKRTGQQVQPSPFIEPVLTHTVAERVTVVVAPIFAFNTRNETVARSLMIDPDENHTVSLGLGTGVRVFPTISLVGEWIPRLWGFKGVIRDRAGFSLGLQKSTFRHAFEFVLSRQVSLTTNQTAVQAGRFGNDTFRIGFNIYRKIR